jgi:hypothetical protein
MRGATQLFFILSPISGTCSNSDDIFIAILWSCVTSQSWEMCGASYASPVQWWQHFPQWWYFYLPLFNVGNFQCSHSGEIFILKVFDLLFAKPVMRDECKDHVPSLFLLSAM